VARDATNTGVIRRVLLKKQTPAITTSAMPAVNIKYRNGMPKMGSVEAIRGALSKAVAILATPVTPRIAPAVNANAVSTDTRVLEGGVSAGIAGDVFMAFPIGEGLVESWSANGSRGSRCGRAWFVGGRPPCIDPGAPRVTAAGVGPFRR